MGTGSRFTPIPTSNPISRSLSRARLTPNSKCFEIPNSTKICPRVWESLPHLREPPDVETGVLLVHGKGYISLLQWLMGRPLRLVRLPTRVDMLWHVLGQPVAVTFRSGTQNLEVVVADEIRNLIPQTSGLGTFIFRNIIKSMKPQGIIGAWDCLSRGSLGNY